MNFLIVKYYYDYKLQYEYKKYKQLDLLAESNFREYIYSKIDTKMINDSCFNLPVELQDIDSLYSFKNTIEYSDVTYPTLESNMYDIINNKIYKNYENKLYAKYYDYWKYYNNESDLIVEYINKYSKKMISLIIRRRINRAIIIVRDLQRISIYFNIDSVKKENIEIISYLPITNKPLDKVFSNVNYEALKYFDKNIDPLSLVYIKVSKITISFKQKENNNRINSFYIMNSSNIGISIDNNAELQNIN